MHINAAAQQLYLIDKDLVVSARKNISEQHIKILRGVADKMVAKQFGSVMDKKFTPPCGNMHEYMSMARYYWPDPSKPDGKPYFRKDGEKILRMI